PVRAGEPGGEPARLRRGRQAAGGDRAAQTPPRGGGRVQARAQAGAPVSAALHRVDHFAEWGGDSRLATNDLGAVSEQPAGALPGACAGNGLAAQPGGRLAPMRRGPGADVVIVARGGGSFEELMAFNQEAVVRAIQAMRIPVVTALGHTSDRTLADLVADREARTPTAAAEIVVPNKADLLRRLGERGQAL